MKPIFKIGAIKPILDVVGQAFAWLKRWVYDEHITYDEPGYTYDGYVEAYSSKKPKVKIGSTKLRVKIK